MNQYTTYVMPVLERRSAHAWQNYRNGPLLEPEDMDRIHRASFDIKKLFGDGLMRQMDHLYHIGEKPGHILLGRDFFTQFVQQAAEHMSYCAFDMPTVWHEHYLSPGWLFAGTRIHCVPWMEGVVVVPKLCPCGGEIAPGAAERGGGAVGLPRSVVGNMDGNAASPDMVDKVIEWLKRAAIEWYSKPPKRFVRSRHFLWWWR